jgi:hypothetical protein
MKKKPLRKRAAKNQKTEHVFFLIATSTLLFLGGENLSFWPRIISLIWRGVLVPLAGSPPASPNSKIMKEH